MTRAPTFTIALLLALFLTLGWMIHGLFRDQPVPLPWTGTATATRITGTPTPLTVFEMVNPCAEVEAQLEDSKGMVLLYREAAERCAEHVQGLVRDCNREDGK